MIKYSTIRVTDENFFNSISTLQQRIQTINDILTSTKPLVLEIATRGAPRLRIPISKTRDENHKSCERTLEMQDDEIDPSNRKKNQNYGEDNFSDEQRYYEDFPTTSKLNFSPHKIFSPRKHRPMKASRPVGDY